MPRIARLVLPGYPIGDISKFIEIRDWREYLDEFEDKELVNRLKNNTLLGRPSVDIGGIEHFGRMLGIELKFSKRGRPKNSVCP